MLSSFTIRFRNIIWFLIFTFTLYCMPHFESLLPYKIHFIPSEAQASESQPIEAQASEVQEKISEEATDQKISPSEELSATPSGRQNGVKSLFLTFPYLFDKNPFDGETSPHSV